MISLHDIRYVRIGTGDIDQAVKFATRMLGLEVADRDSGAAYLRSDDRDHTLVYLDAPVDQHTVGFELRTQEDLDAAAAELEAAGFAVKAGTASPGGGFRELSRTQRHHRGSGREAVAQRTALRAVPSGRNHGLFSHRLVHPVRFAR